MNAHLISPEDVPYLWDNVGPMLASIQQHSEGELEPYDFLDNLMTGNMQLWIATEDKEIIMSMVTEIIKYPQKKIPASQRHLSPMHPYSSVRSQSLAVAPWQ